MDDQRVSSTKESYGTEASGIRQHSCLLGVPPVREFIDFVRARVPAHEPIREEALLEAWRAAAAHLKELEVVERGCADNTPVHDLPDELAGESARVVSDPTFRRSFGPVPCRWGMVELDRIVLHQRMVDLNFVRALSAALPSRLELTDLFRLARGDFAPVPPVLVTRTAENVYTFSSPSADLRVLEMALMDPHLIEHAPMTGQPTHVVGIGVGFSVNCLSALRLQGRLVLHNGTHRAYVLYERGVRLVPCLIREIARDDELDLIGAADVRQNLQTCVRGIRPPLLRDFFDPRLHTVIDVPAVTRLVHVQVSTQRSRLTTG